MAEAIATNAAGTTARSRAYVTNSSDSTVSVIDTATNTVVATVGVGNSPIGVAVGPAPTVTTTTTSTTTSTSTTTTLPTTTTTVPATSSIELDDTVRGNGNRARVTGTLTCPAGEVFRLSVVLTQAGATGSGSTRGTCTGAPQPVSVGITTTSGPSFTAGAVDAEATLDTADAGARVLNDTTTSSETLTYTLS